MGRFLVVVTVSTSVESLKLSFIWFVHLAHIERGSVFVTVWVIAIGVDAAAVVRVTVVVDGLVEVVVDEMELR